MDSIEKLFQKEAEEMKAFVPAFLRECERIDRTAPSATVTLVTSIPLIAAFSSEYFVAYNPTRKTFFRCETKSTHVDIGHVDTPDLATKLDFVDPDVAPQNPLHYLPAGCFDPAELDGYGVFKIKTTSAITPTQHP